MTKASAMKWHRIWILVVCLFAIGSSSVADEPTMSEKPYWRALSQASYDPTPEDLLDHKKQQIIRALRSLDAFLEPAGQQVVSGWKQYIHWPALETELSLAAPNELLLAQSFLDLRCNQVGLETAPFVDLRDSIHDYMHTSRFSCSSEPEAAFDNNLEKLRGLLARYEKNPTRADARQIGSILACLQRSGPSARELEAAIRDEFDRTNAYIRCSQRFLSYMMHRDLGDRKTAINETKDGVTTRGEATTNAEATGKIMPSTETATIDIRLRAYTRAPRTISSTGSVRVFGSFTAQTKASKRLLVSEEGISFSPAKASASAAVQIDNVVADRRLVERIAQRRVNRRKSEAENDLSDNASEQVRKLLDGGVDIMLTDADTVFRDELRKPMLRYGAFPEVFDTASSDGYLQLVVKLAKSAQIGAPTAAPTLDKEHDLAFAVHSSFFENFAELALGGKTIVDTQWLNFMDIMTGNAPRQLWVHDRSRAWSFTFVDRHPIIVVLDDGQFTVTLRGKKVTRGEASVERQIDITSSYIMVETEDGASFRRVGEKTVRWADGTESRTENEQKLFAFIERKFEGLMQPGLYFDRFVPPAGSHFANLRNFFVGEFDFEDEWVTIGYQLDHEERSKVAEIDW
ncbi:MAG: hypothetical protein WBF93_20190 [Pirellulales bacterium]